MRKKRASALAACIDLHLLLRAGRHALTDAAVSLSVLFLATAGLLPKGLHLDAIKDTSLRSEAHRKELSMRGTRSFAIFLTRLPLQISGTGNEHCWRQRQTEVPGWNVRGWKALENPGGTSIAGDSVGTSEVGRPWKILT
ncbi:unnamed protein product [Symbiodinium sp. CCMP2592]|nr:unnamed protein product [Symbiodinium sp. CCMP2592]